MAGGLAKITQDDWSGGIVRAVHPTRIPANGAYDIINGLLDAELGVIYRRGGGAYYDGGNAASSTITAVDHVELAGNDSALVYTLPTGAVYWNDPSNGETAVPSWGTVAQAGADLLTYNGALYAATNGTSPYIYVWGGRPSASAYSTGTISLTLGSQSVTGSGTSWSSSNMPAGSIISVSSGGSTYIGVVASRDSGTTATLTTPWTGPTVSGSAYSMDATYTITVPNAIPTSGEMWASASTGGSTPAVTDLDRHLAFAGNRLFYGFGNRVSFSQIGQPSVFAATDYHDLPYGELIQGFATIRDMLLIFTDHGVYSLENIGLDLTDAAGNPQQTIRPVSGDVRLWAGSGLCYWRGVVVVPGRDNVYLMDGVSTPVPVADAILPFYRTYAQSSTRRVGQAAVFNGHLVLPVLTGAAHGDPPTNADTLVCNLATRAWTRVSGQSGTAMAYRRVIRDGGTYLIAGCSTRVVDCSWFSPEAARKNEADGSTHEFSVTTRDYTLSTLKAMCKKARTWAEGVDAGTDNPTVTLSYAQGPAGSSFTSLGSVSAESTGDAPLDVWRVNVAGKRVRFRLSSTSPFASLKIKALDLFVRPRGRA